MASLAIQDFIIFCYCNSKRSAAYLAYPIRCWLAAADASPGARQHRGAQGLLRRAATAAGATGATGAEAGAAGAAAPGDAHGELGHVGHVRGVGDAGGAQDGRDAHAETRELPETLGLHLVFIWFHLCFEGSFKVQFQSTPRGLMRREC